MADLQIPDFSAMPPAWSRDDEWLQCVQVRDETHDVKTFVFRAEETRAFRYRPGQYMTFTLPVEGRTVYRCYTIASSPTRPDTMSITVKRVANGPASNWLHDFMVPGKRVSVNGPGGEFSCFTSAAETAQHPLLFISGGSGITPMMAMARAFHDIGTNVDLTFVHAARSPQDIIFEHELQLLARNMPRFRLNTVCEFRGQSPWYAGMLGRLNLPMLEAIAPDFAQRHVYCCGPAPFMAAVRSLLATAGFNPEQYREESFSFEKPAAEIPEASDAQAANAEATFEISLSKRGVAFRCRPDQTILQAATEGGLRMPSSCTHGVCGTCRAIKVSGEVEMNQNGALRPREVKQGWMLPCCSKPLSDVVIEA